MQVAERSGTCAPIQGVTRIVMHTGRGEEDRIIADPDRIRQLTSFANARREVAQPQFYTLPAPTRTVAFYRNNEFVCAIGDGPNFFFVSCPKWKGIRDAKMPEIQDFDRLIRVPK